MMTLSGLMTSLAGVLAAISLTMLIEQPGDE